MYGLGFSMDTEAGFMLGSYNGSYKVSWNGFAKGSIRVVLEIRVPFRVPYHIWDLKWDAHLENYSFLRSGFRELLFFAFRVELKGLCKLGLVVPVRVLFKAFKGPVKVYEFDNKGSRRFALNYVGYFAPSTCMGRA